jgi:nucleoid-associated protein YgaU
MQTQPDPSPDPPSAESAVGLAFVAVVLVSLFVAGALGVVVTRGSAPAATTPAKDPDQTAVASASTTLGRERIVARFKELMLLREIALRERDPGLLASVYAPGAGGLAADRAEIARLRSAGRRLDGLRLPVKVLDAAPQGNGRWLVVARIGRSPARLVTGSGRQLRATRASTAVYRCTLVNQNGSWRLLGLVRS